MEMSLTKKARIGWYCLKQAITKPTFSDYAPHKGQAFYANPIPAFKRVMSDKPIFFSPHQAAWCVGGNMETIRKMVRDPRLSISFPDWKFADPKPYDEMTELEKLNANLLMSMPDADHKRVRRLAAPAFNPRTVENLTEDTQTIIDTELDKIDGPFNLPDLTAIIPLKVITAYIGVPEDCYSQLEQVSNSILSSYDPKVAVDQDKANQGLEMIKQLIDEKEAQAQKLIEQYESSSVNLNSSLDDYVTANSKDFLTSLMIKVIREDEGQKISKAEALSLIGSTLAAGPDTTLHHINWALIAMLKNPEVIPRILQDESKQTLERAILEGYRWDHFAHSGGVRFAKEDVEYFGQTIKKGEMIRIMNCAAVTCEKKFPNPLQYNIDRENLNELVVFGIGPHYCLGAAMASKITSMTIWSFLQRFPNTKILEEPLYKNHYVARHIERLMVDPNQPKMH